MNRRVWTIGAVPAAALALVAVVDTTAGVSARQLKPKPADEWSASLERPDRVAGLKIVDRSDIRPIHPRVADETDPLHAARASEVTFVSMSADIRVGPRG